MGIVCMYSGYNTVPNVGGHPIYFVLVDTDEGLSPVNPSVTIDYIDRGHQPWCGNGNVYISHVTGRAIIDTERLANWKPVFNDPGLTSFSGYVIADLRIMSSYMDSDVSGNSDVFCAGWHSSADVVTLDGSRNRSDNGCYIRYARLHYINGRWNAYTGFFSGDWGTPHISAGSVSDAIDKARDLIPTGPFRGPLESPGEIGRWQYMSAEPIIAQVPNPDLHEYTSWMWENEYGASNGLRAHYFGMAFYNAIENLPQLATNNIANLMELISSAAALYGAIRGRLQGFAQLSAKEAWLAYRYSYNTTKADIEELASYLSRISDLRILNSRVKTRGSYHIGSESYGAVMSVGGRGVIPPDLKGVLSSKYWMETLGLGATLENIWDLIPFSFVVDWFLGIGDKLHILTQKDRMIQLDITDIWYTYRNNWRKGYADYSVYSRYAGSRYMGIPWELNPGGVSPTSWSMRVGDGLALFG